MLNQQLINAFSVLQLEPDVEYSVALKSYKRLALIHHPDRNHNDKTATERFQQIGEAWSICQKHFDNPAWSRIPDPSQASSCHHHHSFNSSYDSQGEDDDDDYFMNQDDIHAYYMFMFAETLANRFSRTTRKHYRRQTSRASPAPGAFSYYYPHTAFSTHSRTTSTQPEVQESQRREKEEYEKRKRQLELEIEEEERQKEKAAKDAKSDQDRRASVVDTIYQAAYSGHSSAVQKAILEHDLDVNTPRKRAKHNVNQEKVLQQHESLLHVAASNCDETLLMFLVERGADTKALNRQQLTPFHAAIKAGNTRVVRFIMNRRGRSFEGYHPSKAAASGRTPLQLAIESHQPSMIELLLKEATTHDVERCWNQEGLSEDIKNILRTKKGFVSPENKPALSNLSKKGHKKQDVSQEKAAQLALEQERARINREKREASVTKRALELKEADEHACKEAELAEKRRLDDKERQQREHTEALRKAEEAQAEEQRRLERERLTLEKERLRPRSDRDDAVELDGKRQQAQDLTKKPATTSHLRDEHQREQLPSATPFVGSRLIKQAKPGRLTEEERKEIRREKQREKRRVKAATRSECKPEVQETSPRTTKVTTQLRTQKKPEDMTPKEREEYDQVLQRRAEQSARDKRRAQEWREKRAQNPTEYTPLTPVSTHTHSRYQTPSAMTALEEMQTCIVPDDLFEENERWNVLYDAYFARTVGPIDELFFQEGEGGPYVRV